MKPKIILVVVSVALLCLLSGCRWDGARRVDTVVNEEIRAGHFPGAVVLVGDSKRILYCQAFGQAVAQPFETPMNVGQQLLYARLRHSGAALPVVANHLLMVGDHSRLDGGRPPRFLYDAAG